MTDTSAEAELVEELDQEATIEIESAGYMSSLGKRLRRMETTARKLIRERDELRAQLSEYATKNTDLMNDLVLMGMARDEARNNALEEAAAECMKENQRRLDLASIRVPAMASEIRDAIRALKSEAKA